MKIRRLSNDFLSTRAPMNEIGTSREGSLNDPGIDLSTYLDGQFREADSCG